MLIYKQAHTKLLMLMTYSCDQYSLIEQSYCTIGEYRLSLHGKEMEGFQPSQYYYYYYSHSNYYPLKMAEY